MKDYSVYMRIASTTYQGGLTGMSGRVQTSTFDLLVARRLEAEPGSNQRSVGCTQAAAEVNSLMLRKHK